MFIVIYLKYSRNIIPGALKFQHTTRSVPVCAPKLGEVFLCLLPLTHTTLLSLSFFCLSFRDKSPVGLCYLSGSPSFSFLLPLAPGSHPHQLADGVWSMHRHTDTDTQTIQGGMLKNHLVCMYTPGPEGPWNMHSKPMHNTWAQQEERTCEPSGSPPLHSTPLLLSSFTSLHHTVCCCCVYVLNNNCLSVICGSEIVMEGAHERCREK